MIEGQINRQFGRMVLSNKRYAYPLVSTWAQKFYAERYALLGDAAVGMHPVTAHGYNLGLKGADNLAQIIKGQIARGLDIGAQNGLRRYHRQHQKAALLIYHGTNALVKLYTSENPLARTARASLLRLGDLLAPARKLIMQELTEERRLKV
jgi:2-polyprenyl-6-methoxyphenol hydroxylase-like FAD-dependent oxidoreductase